MTIEIPLTKGHVAIVDDIDADLADLKWCALHRHDKLVFYARRNVPTPNAKNRQATELMHRVILARVLGRSLRKGELVDHRDGNGLNNRRDNLRVATPRENASNCRLYSSNTSNFKGVYWHNASGKWNAQIRVNNKRISLGYFDDPEEAHAAYCEAARKYHGEFANFGAAQS